ncbi:centromere protein F-like [Hydractinia symbiolongicarpus]|uniref:centromere protein F-like n=1 Tax=Hydractinia symbiolongicarpus TaxID=13093 RepID=UPI00254AE52D|nr:centromere protein F-like [Hydractinia symbiolongicarpus]
MSWAQDEWKNNLPHNALLKIDGLERCVEQLKKDQQQKKFQVESLEAAFENQKKKTEEQKLQVAICRKDVQNLEEQCRTSEANREKAIYELDAKRAQLSCLEGQLTKYKQNLEKEVSKASKLLVELEREVLQRNKVVDQLQQKDNDLQKLQQRLKLSSSDDVFSSDKETTSKMAGEVVHTLISFDEPMAPPPSTLGHPSGNLLDCSIATPIKNNKNSSTGSQHCTFDIFGEDVEMKSGSTGAVNNNDSTDWKTKCTDLQTKLKSLEFEISSEQSKCKDVTLKFENLKAELNSKTSECLKAENEVIKLTASVDQKDNKVLQLDQSIKQLQQQYECERHNTQAAMKAQDERIKEQEKNMREELARDQKLAEDQVKEMQKSLVEVEKKYNESLREYKTLERNLFQANHEKESLVHTVEELKQEVPRLKSEHQHVLAEVKRDLEEAHKKQIASFEIRLQEKQRDNAVMADEYNKVKNEISSLNKALAEMNDKYMKAIDEKNNAEKRVAQLSLAMEELNQTSVAKLKEVEKQLSEKLKEKEEHNSSLSKSVQEHLQKLEEYRKEVDVKKQSAEEYKYKYESAEATLNKLKKEKTDVEKEYALHMKDAEKRELELVKSAERAEHAEKVIKEQHNLLQVQVDKSNHELSVLKEKFNSSSNALQAKERELSCLAEQCEATVKKLSQKEEQLKVVDETIRRITEERNKYQKEFQEFEGRIDKKNTEIETLSTCLDEVKAIENELQGRVGELHRAVEEKTSKLEAVLAKEKEWKVELNTKEGLLDKMGEKLHNLEEEKNSLLELAEQRQQVVTQRDNQVQKITAECEDLSRRLEEEAEFKKSLEAKCMDVSTKLDQSHQALHDKCMELNKMEKEFQEQYGNAKEEIQLVLKEKENLFEKIQSLEESFDGLQQIKLRTEANMLMMAEDRESLLQEKNELNTKFEEMQSEVTDVTNKYSQLTKQYEELCSLIQVKEEEIATFKDNQVKLEQEHHFKEQELKSTVNELTMKNEELEESVLTMTSENEQFETKATTIEKEYNIMSSELSSLSIDYEKIKSERDKLSTENQTFNAKLEESSDLLQSKDTAVQELTKQVESLRDDMQMKTKSYEDLMTERNNVQAQLEITQDDLNQINEALFQKQEELDCVSSESSGKIAELMTRVEQQIEQIQELRERIEYLEEKLNALDSLMKEKEEELRRASERVTKLEEELQASSEHVIKLSSDKRDVEVQLSTACGELEQKLRMIDDRDNSLLTLTEEMKKNNEAYDKDMTSRDEQIKNMECKMSFVASELQQANDLLQTREEDNEELLEKVEELMKESDELNEKLAAEQKLSEEQRCLTQQLGEKHKMTEAMYTESKMYSEELEKKIRVGESKLSELEIDIDTLNDKIESLVVNANKLESDLSNKTEECNLLQSDCENTRCQFQELSIAMERKDVELKSSADEILQLKNEKSLAESMLASANEKFMLTGEERVKLLQEAEELKQCLKNTEASLENARTLQSEVNNKMQEDALHHRDEVEKKEDKIREMKVQMSACQSSVETHINTINVIKIRFEEERTAHQNEVTRLSKENAELQERLNYLENQIKILQESLSEKEESLTDMLNQAEETDEILMKLRKEHDSLSNEKIENEARHQKEVEQYQDTLNKKQGKLKALMDSNDTLQNKVVMFAELMESVQNKLKQEQDRHTQDSIKWSKKMAELEGVLKEKHAEIETTSTEFDQLKTSHGKEVHKLKSSVANLTDTLKERDTQHEQVVQGLTEQFEQKHREIQEELEVKIMQYNSLQTNYDENVQGSEKSLRDKEVVISELKEVLSEKEKSMAELGLNLNNIQLQLSNVTCEKEHLFSELEKCSKDLRAAMSQIDAEGLTFKERMIEADKAITSLESNHQSEIERFESEMARLKEKQDDLQAAKEILESRCQKLEEELSTKEGIFQESESKSEALGAALKQRENELQEMQSRHAEERSECENKMSTLQGSLNNTLQKLELACKEHETVTQKYESLEKDMVVKIKALECSVFQSRQQADLFKADIDAKETLISGLNEESEELTNKNQEIESCYEEQLNDLNDALLQTEKKLEKKCEEVAELTSRVTNLKQETLLSSTQSEQERQHMEANFKELLSEKEQVILKVNGLLEEKKTSLLEKNKVIKQLNVEVEEKEACATSLQEKIKNLTQQFEDAVTTYEQQADDIRASLSSFKNDNQLLQEKIEDLKIEARNEKETIQGELNARVDSLSSENSTLAETMKSLELCIEEKNNKVTELLEKIKEDKNKLESCEDSIKTLTAEECRLKEKNEILKSEVHTGCKAKEELEIQCSELTDHRISLQAELSTTKEELDSVNLALKAKDSENTELKEKLKGLYNLKSDLDGNLREQSRKLIDLETRFRDMMEKVSKIKQERDELVEKLTKSEEKNLQLEKDAISTREKLENCKETLEHAESALVATETKLNEVLSLLRQRDEELNDALGKHEELTLQLQNKETECVSNVEDIRKLQEKIEKNEIMINDCECDKRSLQQQVDELRDEISSVQVCKDELAVNLKENIERFTSEKLELVNKLSSAESVTAEVSEELGECKTVLNVLKDDITTLTERKEDLKKQNKILADKLKEEEKGAEKAIQHGDDLSIKLKAVLSDKDSAVQSLIDEKEKLKTRNCEINELYKNVSAEKENLSSQLVNFSREQNQAEEVISSLKVDKEELTKKLEDTEKVLEEGAALQVVLKEELLQSNSLCESLQRETSEVQQAVEKELNELKENVVEKDDWLREKDLKIGKLEQDIETLRKKLTESEDALSYAGTMKEEFATQLEDTQKLLQAERKARCEAEQLCETHLETIKTLKEEVRKIKESFEYLTTVKLEMNEELQSKATELDNAKKEKETVLKQLETCKARLDDLESKTVREKELNDQVQKERDHFKSEVNKLRICFDTLNEEKHKNVENLNQVNIKLQEMQTLLDAKQKEVRKMEEALGNEKENNVCHKAEISNLNISLVEAQKSAEKEKRRVKKLQHDMEKKDLSISELEQQLNSLNCQLATKENALKETVENLTRAENTLSLEKEMHTSKQAKLEEIKKSLMRSRALSSQEDITSDNSNLDETIDFNSQILKLQEEIVKLEKDKKQMVEAAVEEERLRIVEASKQFVLEREKENETRNQDLLDDIKLKEKKITNLQKTISQKEEECKQFEYILSKEKETYQELLKTSEEEKNVTSVTAPAERFNGDEINEMRERLERAKLQNEELRGDFAKTVDDYERAKAKESREFGKLKEQCENFKSLCEKKDVDLKRLKALTIEPRRNEKLLEDLREKLMSSDEKYITLEFKNEDLQNALKSATKKHEIEMSGISKKLSSLMKDNDQLRLKLEETMKRLSLLEKENLILKKDLAAYPFAKNSMVSPLTRSLSSLKVLSSEDDSTNDVSSIQTNSSIQTDSSRVQSQAKGILKKSSETPKRSMESTESLSSKANSKRTRLNTVIEHSNGYETKISPSSAADQSGRRRSTRLARKPYSREMPSSSSDDEVLQKQLSGSTTSHPTKENPAHARVTRARDKETTPLSPKKTNITDLNSSLTVPKKPHRDLGMPTRIVGNKNVQQGPCRATRLNSTRNADAEVTSKHSVKARPSLRSDGNSEQEEKCNMQ